MNYYNLTDYIMHYGHDCACSLVSRVIFNSRYANLLSNSILNKATGMSESNLVKIPEVVGLGMLPSRVKSYSLVCNTHHGNRKPG